MHAAVLQEIDQLRGMTLTQLRERYQEVYGEPCRSRHKVHVFWGFSRSRFVVTWAQKPHSISPNLLRCQFGSRD